MQAHPVVSGLVCVGGGVMVFKINEPSRSEKKRPSLELDSENVFESVTYHQVV